MAGYFKKVKTPWTKQPQIPAGIDKNNPDTRGLILATLSGSKVYDATRKEPLSSGSVIDRTASNFNLNDDSKNWLTTYGGVYSIIAKNRVFTPAFGTRAWFVTRVAYPTSGIYHHIDASGNYVFSHWNGVDYYANSFLGRSDKDEILVTYDGTNIGFTLWSAGTTKYTYSAALAQYAASSSGSGFMGTDNGQSIGAEWFFVFNRVLSEAEALRIRAAPWKLFTPQERRVFVNIATSGVTGTLSSTLDSFTSNLSGTTTIVGSINNTFSSFTSSITGFSTIVGQIAYTNQDVTSNITGTTAVMGQIAVTNQDSTSNITGDVGSGTTGTINSTLQNSTSSIQGTTQIMGTMSVIMESFTSVIQGTTTILGTISKTMDDFISSISGFIGEAKARLLSLLGVGS